MQYEGGSDDDDQDFKEDSDYNEDSEPVSKVTKNGKSNMEQKISRPKDIYPIIHINESAPVSHSNTSNSLSNPPLKSQKTLAEVLKELK